MKKIHGELQIQNACIQCLLGPKMSLHSAQEGVFEYAVTLPRQGTWPPFYGWKKRIFYWLFITLLPLPNKTPLQSYQQHTKVVRKLVMPPL